MYVDDAEETDTEGEGTRQRRRCDGGKGTWEGEEKSFFPSSPK